MAGNSGVATPQQERSKESFARVRAAVVELLIEGGPRNVRIAEVSARAGVSVGTIYGRVGNRANLLRVVHHDELDRIAQSMVASLSTVDNADPHERIREVMSVFIRESAQNARLTAALVALSLDDDELAETGPATWRTIQRAVIEALGWQGNGDRAWMEWVFEVIFAVTLRAIDSGALEEGFDGSGTVALRDNLAATVEALLQRPTPR